MRTSSPRPLAIIIGILTAVAAAGAGMAVFLMNGENIALILVFVGLLVFFIIYLLVFYSVNRFILEKIKPIYKTILSASQVEEKLTNEIEDDNIIEDVQNDVLLWAKKKAREISQLRQLEKYRREFLGDVSHELKTPIFNIQGYILTLLDGGLEDSKINRLYLERTEKSVNRLISIVNDLESIARLESGEQKLDYRKFDMIKLIEEVYEDHYLQAKERKIKLKFIRPSEKTVMVYADRERIMEVMNNLIGNSVKYGKEKGQTVASFLDMEENVMIELTDNGIGISEKDLPRIFERFFRTDKSRSREMGGTGLGLSIVKHIIEAHNQTINVQSKPGEGTSFTFTLKKA
jgi:two-component system, OmpR family, phosphate regulon sensor histidine kinase PhoR